MQFLKTMQNHRQQCRSHFCEGASLLQHKPFIPIGCHLRTLLPKEYVAARIEEESTFLARNIRPQKPRVGLGYERASDQLVTVRHPRLFRLWGGHNALEVLLAHITDAVAHPFRNDLGAAREVAEHCTIDDEEIRETRGLD